MQTGKFITRWVFSGGFGVLLLIGQPFTVLAAYKCVNSTGNIEYVDLPKEGTTCTQLRPVPAPTPVNAEPDPAASEQPETAAIDDPKQKNCDVAQGNLKTLQSDKDVVVSDKDGNKTLLNKEQREAELAQAQKDVNYWCN